MSGATKKGYVTLTPVEDDDDEDLDDAPVKEYSADILLDSEYQTAPGKSWPFYEHVGVLDIQHPWLLY